MTPGYLRKSAVEDVALREQENKFLIKNREVHNEPWWGQLNIAAIYAFKFNYDRKASATGHGPISLAHATAAYQYMQSGSIQVADRSMQDLFVNIKAYRLGVPRLRLFAAFLGDGRDLDVVVADMLKTPQAVTVYFNLLVEIHREVWSMRYETFEKLQKSVEAKLTQIAKFFLNETKTVVDNESNEDDDEKDQKQKNDAIAAEETRASNKATEEKLKQMNLSIKFTLQSMANESPNGIQVLFPCTDDTFQRFDKREVWHMHPSILKRVLVRWTAAQKYLAGKFNVYIELIDKLKLNSAGEVEVDDFLWIILQQWAKLEDWAVKRSVLKSNSFLKDYPMQKTNPTRMLSSVQTTTTVVDASNNNNNTMDITSRKKPVEARFLHVTPMSNMLNLVESIYRPGEGVFLVDPLFVSHAYINGICAQKSTRTILLQNNNNNNVVASKRGLVNDEKMFIPDGSKFSIEIQKFVKNSILWNTNENSLLHIVSNTSSSTSSLVHGQTINPNDAKHRGHLMHAMHRATQKIVHSTSNVANTFSSSSSMHDVVASMTHKTSQQRLVSNSKLLSTNNEIAASNEDDNKASSFHTNNSIVKKNTFLYRNHDISLSLFTTHLTEVFSPTNVELSLVAAKKTFLTFHDVSNAFINKVLENTRFNGNVDVEHKINAIRQQSSLLTEKFSVINNNSTSTSQNSGVNYNSFKLFLLSTKNSISQDFFAEDETEDSFFSFEFVEEFCTAIQTMFNQMQTLHNDVFESNKTTTEVWILLRKMFADLTDLSFLTGYSFPRDAWHVGVKQHVDRAFVYNIPTKSSVTL